MNNKITDLLNRWGINRFVLMIFILLILDLYNLIFVDKVFGYEFIVDIITQCVILLPLYMMHRQQDDNVRKLQDSEQRYKSLFLYNNAGIYVINLDGTINSVSPNLLDNLGYLETDIKGVPFLSLFRPDEHPFIEQTFKDIVNRTILSTSKKLQMRHKNGEYLIFDLSSVALMANGEVEGVIGFAKDITEFERVQGKLGEMQTQLNNIYKSIDIIIWSYNVTESRMLTISPACEKILGYSPEEYYQYPHLWLAQIHHEDRDLVMNRLSMTSEGIPVLSNLECRIVHSTGEIRWVEIRMFPVIDSKLGTVGVNGVLLDITRKKLIEQNSEIDLDLARQVQKSVLSQPIYTPLFSIDAKYLPSRNLGGDMYAWYRLDEHRYGILIMDVMGHGVSSSLICMSIRSLLRGIIQPTLSPEQVIQELNSHMNRLFSGAMGATRFFFTAIYLIVDTEKSLIEYINAGHPSGLLLDDGGEIQLLESSCIPIGLIPDLNPERQTIEFKGKARLLLYTDGLIEVQGSLLVEQIKALGTVMEATRTHSISEVLDKLLISRIGTEQGETDDVCLICLEVESPQDLVAYDMPLA